MKKATQITFAFQDPPESGENPGVGVRIKSLKKGTNEKEPTEMAGEGQPEVKKQPEKPAELKLFEETSVDQVTQEQTPANQIEAKEDGQTETQLDAYTESHIEAKTEANSEAHTEVQREAQREAQITDQAGNKPEDQTGNQPKDQTGYKPGYESGRQSGDQTGHLPGDHTENESDLIKDQAQNEDDADLPIFRGSSLSTQLSELTGAEIKDSALDRNEMESQDGDESDEQDNSNSVTDKVSKSTRGRKSLKTIDEGAELINIPPDEVLFKKQYYAIGEVAEMFHVNQSLLRFWETEFDIIQPRKNRKGDRHFRPVDIKNLLLIHDLLRRRKLTIEGAKDFLKKNKRSPERFAMIQSLQKIKGFILEIKATL